MRSHSETFSVGISTCFRLRHSTERVQLKCFYREFSRDALSDGKLSPLREWIRRSSVGWVSSKAEIVTIDRSSSCFWHSHYGISCGWWCRLVEGYAILKIFSHNHSNGTETELLPSLVARVKFIQRSARIEIYFLGNSRDPNHFRSRRFNLLVWRFSDCSANGRGRLWMLHKKRFSWTRLNYLVWSFWEYIWIRRAIQARFETW